MAITTSKALTGKFNMSYNMKKAVMQENLSSGFLMRGNSNQPTQLQRLVRTLQFCMELI